MTTETTLNEAAQQETVLLAGTPSEVLSDEIAEETTGSKKAKKVKEEEAPPGPQGIVLYTDGGCRPNPGPGGWGIHGYLFRDEKPKKGAGNPDHVLTQQGYVTKVKMAAAGGAKDYREVVPVHYVDGFGSFAETITNNIAELAAATAGLKYAVDYDVKTVLILTDSEYTRKGLEGWVDNWARNGWVKSDGSEIANVRYWKALVEARDQLRARGAEVSIKWVKGHDDVLGNVQADRLATIAVMVSRGQDARQEIASSAAEGYWKYEPDRHPFLNHRRMYMNTQQRFNRPGEYYIGEHGKDDELLGKRISDGAYAMVQLEKHDSVLELVRQRQIELADEIDTLVMLRLDHLYRPEVHQQLSNYGNHALLQPNPFRLDLTDVEEEPISKELRPPRLAHRAVEAIEELGTQLSAYLRQDPGICVTDLTPILYETAVKVDKKGESTTTMKLMPQYNVGFAALEVDANYLNGSEVSCASVILTLGIDMLDRNSLKRLEDRLPKVSLISWTEAPGTFRYATVIEAGNDKGIWAGVYSNLRIIT